MKRFPTLFVCLILALSLSSQSCQAWHATGFSLQMGNYNQALGVPVLACNQNINAQLNYHAALARQLQAQQYAQQLRNLGNPYGSFASLSYASPAPFVPAQPLVGVGVGSYGYGGGFGLGVGYGYGSNFNLNINNQRRLGNGHHHH